ncbi:MAG: hypothetical protein KTR13_10705 [Saprospiraceae bacterium]|nr:hypothetical protein [Saprospiraceae bacterium]
MNKQEVTSNLRSLSVIHAALCMGVIIFLSVIYFGLKPEKLEPTNTIFLILGGMLVLTGISASLIFYRSLLSKLNEADSIGAKFTTYRSASIIRYALLEGPTLVNSVFFLLTGNPIHLYIALAGVAILFLSRPTLQQFVNDARLTGDERRSLGL